MKGRRTGAADLLPSCVLLLVLLLVGMARTHGDAPAGEAAPHSAKDGLQQLSRPHVHSLTPVCFKHNQTINVTGAPAFKRAMTDEELMPLYRANLFEDMAYWSDVTQRRGRLFGVADIVEQLKRTMWSPYVGVIIVQDGVPYRFKSNDMLSFATLRIIRLQKEIVRLHDSGNPFPNTILIFNAEDVPICHRLHGCRVPIFTLFKRLARNRSASAASDPPWSLRSKAGSDSPPSSSTVPLQQEGPLEYLDEEILLPNFNQDWDRLCFFPWEKKNASALMRASLQVTMTEESTRYYLTKLSASSEEAGRLLDAGIVWNNSTRFNLTKGQMRHYVGMRKHCMWRFLLNTDGHTASSRMGHLLGHNSVVLKEKSPWVEYYYRALVPGRDHLDFEPPSLLQQLKELQAPERDAELQRIASAGQQFAHSYLHTTAKALYARQAIIQYNTLFKGLEDFVANLPLAKHTYVGRHPPTIRDLMSTLCDLTGVTW